MLHSEDNFLKVLIFSVYYNCCFLDQLLNLYIIGIRTDVMWQLEVKNGLKLIGVGERMQL